MKNPKIISLETRENQPDRLLVFVDGKLSTRFSVNAQEEALTFLLRHAFQLKYDYGNPVVKIVFKGAMAEFITKGSSMTTDEVSFGVEEIS